MKECMYVKHGFVCFKWSSKRNSLTTHFGMVICIHYLARVYSKLTQGHFLQTFTSFRKCHCKDHWQILFGLEERMRVFQPRGVEEWMTIFQPRKTEEKMTIFQKRSSRCLLKWPYCFTDSEYNHYPAWLSFRNDTISINVCGMSVLVAN